jgi:hypothetical protein
VHVQVSAASASGCSADLDTISEELFQQLSSGQTVNLSSLLRPGMAQLQAASGAGSLVVLALVVADPH